MALVSLGEITEFVHGTLIGDAEFSIRGIGDLADAAPDQITFLSDKRRAAEAKTTQAGAILLEPGVEASPAHRIEVSDPYWAYARATALFSIADRPEGEECHASAIVDPTARLGQGVRIGPLCVIGRNAALGDHTVLHAGVRVGEDTCVGEGGVLHENVVLCKGTRIGKRVIVQAGAVLGSDGFGFAEKGGKYTKIHQLGWVEIGDDVEIGANACIDRGAIGPTRIGEGVKIDNLVHIAHNVQVGAHSAMAAQVGVSGTVAIGRRVKMGGQAGVAGHLTIGDNAFVGAQAGVTKSVEEGAAVSGYPARNHGKAKKIEAILSSLPEWIRRIRKLEKDQPTP